MNLSFKTQGVKESLTMVLSYLCCALLLCLDARHWYWANARSRSEKVDLLPAGAGFANQCWLLKYWGLYFVFSEFLGFTVILSFLPSCLREADAGRSGYRRSELHWSSCVELPYAALRRAVAGWLRRWCYWPVQAVGRTIARATA